MVDLQVETDMISRKQKQVVDDFQSMTDWQDRYRYLIDLGESLSTLPKQYQTDTFLIKGCQSRVWLVKQVINQRLSLLGFSDAAIVRGLMAMLIAIYQDGYVNAVKAAKTDFLHEIGFDQYLSVTRFNGLQLVIKAIHAG